MWNVMFALRETEEGFEATPCWGYITGNVVPGKWRYIRCESLSLSLYLKFEYSEYLLVFSAYSLSTWVKSTCIYLRIVENQRDRLAWFYWQLLLVTRHKRFPALNLSMTFSPIAYYLQFNWKYSRTSFVRPPIFWGFLVENSGTWNANQ